jgi:hypothetical protein
MAPSKFCFYQSRRKTKAISLSEQEKGKPLFRDGLPSNLLHCIRASAVDAQTPHGYCITYCTVT